MGGLSKDCRRVVLQALLDLGPKVALYGGQSLDPATDTGYDATGEVAGDEGAGGVALSGGAVTYDSGDDKYLLDFDDPTFTNCTGTVDQARVYFPGAGGGLVLDLDQAYDLAGDDITIHLPASGASTSLFRA